MLDIKFANILSDLPDDKALEFFETLCESGGTRIERIVSNGQVTPEGEWYDQEQDEWVMLLSGSASILLEGEPEPRKLVPGDYLLIPAHCRHRVVRTDLLAATVWLAVHFGGSSFK